MEIPDNMLEIQGKIIALMHQRERDLRQEGMVLTDHDALLMQADFLSGAMNVLQLLFPNDDPALMSGVIPPSWPIFILTGRKIEEKQE